MISLHFFLWIFAAICFFLATIGYPKPEKVNLIALGLLLGTLTFIIR